MESRGSSPSVLVSKEVDDIYSFGTKFGIIWFDKWFCKCLEDDSLGDCFQIVSDSLGCLVIGQYDSKMKQYALLSLLGPAFVGKHFVGENKVDIRGLENLRQEDVYKDSKKYEATFSKIKTDLDNLSMVAWKKVLSSDELTRLQQRIKESIQNAIAQQISFTHFGNHNIRCIANPSIRSFLSDNGDQQDAETIIGDSLAAIIEIDEEETHNLGILEKTKESFKDNAIMIPEDLRIPIWESEYMDKECKRQNQNEDKIFHTFVQNMQQEKSTQKPVNSERISKYVIDMHKHWPGLRDFEDKLGKQQLLSVRVLACFSG